MFELVNQSPELLTDGLLDPTVQIRLSENAPC